MFWGMGGFSSDHYVTVAATRPDTAGGAVARGGSDERPARNKRRRSRSVTSRRLVCFGIETSALPESINDRIKCYLNGPQPYCRTLITY